MDINRTRTTKTGARKRELLSGWAAVLAVVIVAFVGAGAYALGTTDLAGSLTAPLGQQESIPPAGREALAASRGDAAAQAVLEEATDTRASEPDVESVGDEGLDSRTRNALQAASRGDAPAQGSVSAEPSGSAGEEVSGE